MRTFRVLVSSVLAIAASAVVTTPAYAQLTNDVKPLTDSCKLTHDHPFPVVLVHGQSGNVEGMQDITNRLQQDGFCVYGTNYGTVAGGTTGQDHLWNSAAQIGAFVDVVLNKTGAKMVDLVGHSAGTGVADNYILQRAGASKVHSFVSFGGLHHPYWHLGVAKYADIDIHLPNLLIFGRQFFPGLTIQQATDIVALFVGDPGLKATVKSPFVEDLFDANYWALLHGGQSEPPGVFVKILSQGRTLPTRDSMPGICYTNIVAIGDMLVGGSTGWQDVNANIDNYLEESNPTVNNHIDMISNQAALDKMVSGLRRTCGNFATNLELPGSPSSDTPDGGAASGSSDDQDAKRELRQQDFGKDFLLAVQDKYGSELQRSDEPFPWESGGRGGSSEDGGTSGSQAQSSDQGGLVNGQGASSCSMSRAPTGRSTTAILLGMVGLALAARSRKTRAR